MKKTTTIMASCLAAAVLFSACGNAPAAETTAAMTQATTQAAGEAQNTTMETTAASAADTAAVAVTPVDLNAFCESLATIQGSQILADRTATDYDSGATKSDIPEKLLAIHAQRNCCTVEELPDQVVSEFNCLGMRCEANGHIFAYSICLRIDSNKGTHSTAMSRVPFSCLVLLLLSHRVDRNVDSFIFCPQNCPQSLLTSLRLRRPADLHRHRNNRCFC